MAIIDHLQIILFLEFIHIFAQRSEFTQLKTRDSSESRMSEIYGCANPNGEVKTYYLANFTWKLHENCGRVGVVEARVPLNLPMVEPNV